MTSDISWHECACDCHRCSNECAWHFFYCCVERRMAKALLSMPFVSSDEMWAIRELKLLMRVPTSESHMQS